MRPRWRVGSIRGGWDNPRGTFLAGALKMPDVRGLSRGSVLMAMLVFSVPLGGCFTTTPEMHSLGMVAVEPPGLGFRILERDVRARHCKAALGSSGDLGEAVEKAVSQVDDAQVLVNASVYVQQKGSGVCVEVVGDAAAID